MRSGPKRFLIVKIGALGDVCFALPAVNALKQALPNARVDWLVGARDADLVRGLRGLDRLWVVDSEAVYRRDLRALFRQARRWRRAMDGYDAVLVLHRNWGYVSWLALTFGFPPPVVYRLSRARTRLPRLVSVRVEPLSLHESTAIRRLVERVVADSGGGEFEWTWDFSHMVAASSLVRSLDRPYWVVHAGGGRNTKMVFALKQWPHWDALLARLVDLTPVSWVVVGAPEERREFADHPRMVNWIGRTTAPQLVDLIRGAHGFIGVDSGPLHLADALGVPAIGLYGPTSPVSWGLLSATSRALSMGVACAPCYRDDGVMPRCEHGHACMETLNCERVVELVVARGDRNAWES